LSTEAPVLVTGNWLLVTGEWIFDSIGTFLIRHLNIESGGGISQQRIGRKGV
jgi:hypothetical protein